MSLKEIVNVIITRETTPVSQVGFSTLLVLGPSAPAGFTERLRFYTDADDMFDDGYEAADPEYLAVLAAFSQNPRPERVAVGRKDVAESWVEALNAIRDENDDWYGLVITSRAEADQQAVAAWVEAETKLAGFATADAETLAATAGDIGGLLEAAGYVRSFVVYHPDAATSFPDAAWMAGQLATAPGSTTWKFKKLTGVPTVKLTATQSTNARNKNVNTYEEIGGVGIMREGKVAGNEFIDVIVGVDWFQARLTERVFGRLVNLPKIPYTNAGVAVIEAEIRAQYQLGVDHDFLAADPDLVVTVPDVADVPFNDRANRHLPDVKFRATLAGAIHSVEINGVVTV